VVNLELGIMKLTTAFPFETLLPIILHTSSTLMANLRIGYVQLSTKIYTMKYLLSLSLLFLVGFVPATTSIHQFKVKDIDGGTIDFSSFKGKKILVVNTASKCGYTYQYEGLEELYKKYKGKLVVVGFPANNFMGQEPGTNEEIKEFCTGKFNVTFPMAAKVSVKGSDIDPLFAWLTQKSENGVMDAKINWNFNKFLLDENGQLIEHWSNKVEPMSEEITKYLK
jgi:glutathione peroxidase